MKVFIIAFVMVYYQYADAQLTIMPGAQFTLSGNAQLTLHNTDLINNGNLATGTATISFTGNSVASISGTQATQFYILEISKAGTASVSLQRNIDVNNKINFTSGFLDLGNFNIDLGTTGTLNGEHESSRVVGTGVGQLLATANLNTPSSSNPGNLGAIFTSSQNLGSTLIKRGCKSQTNPYGNGNSILRYYEIVPTNNIGLNAVLRLQYFDGELNGLDENGLTFWKSANGINWTEQGFTSRNTSSNYVEKTGINEFSTWTLSSPGNALPVTFVLVHANCRSNQVDLEWTTANETNLSHFEIQKTNDGQSWSVLASLPAVNNNAIRSNYSFIDNHPSENSYYRVVALGINGRAEYSGILRTSCQVQEDFGLWPNPAFTNVHVNIFTQSTSAAIIQLVDSKGSLVKLLHQNLTKGYNLFEVNMTDLPNGTYQCIISWDNGNLKKVVPVVKQR